MYCIGGALYLSLVGLGVHVVPLMCCFPFNVSHLPYCVPYVVGLAWVCVLSPLVDGMGVGVVPFGGLKVGVQLMCCIPIDVLHPIGSQLMYCIPLL